MAEEQNNNILMGGIIVLLLIIAIMGYFLGVQQGEKNNESNSDNNIVSDKKINYEELTLTVIDDKRCTNCPTDAILEQLKQLPSISKAKIKRKDFSDEGVKDYLNENKVKTLPLIVFSTKNFDTSKDPEQKDQSGQVVPPVNTFLEPLDSGEFTIAIGSTFNPFVERSEKGFMMLDKEKLKLIKDNSYIKGNKDSKITWIEYSDLECPFCAKLYNAGTTEDLSKKYGDDLNIVFNHFPLSFHKNAQVGAEILECLGEEKGSEAFYSLIKKAFEDKKSDKSYLIDEAIVLGGTKSKLEKCLDSGKYTDKVKNQMKLGADLFSITGTPGNVLINNETSEYEVISGAYPTTAFEEIIDKLLK